MMSPTHTVSPEWGNENALRAYPLHDDCLAAEIVPAWLMSDLHVTADIRYVRLFVSSVYVSSVLVSVGISGAKDDGSTEGLLTKTLTIDELEPFKAYSMERMSGLASGTVAFGEVPAGHGSMHRTFTPDEAPLVPSSVTRIRAPGVTRIVDRAYGSSADGIIDLSGNSEFRTYLGSDGAIVVELSDMYRDMTTSVCNATPSFDACGIIPVKTVNGVAPTEAGVLTLKFR